MSNTFNERERSDALQHDQRRARRPAGQTLRLRRHQEDRWFAGIAGGIAMFVGADPRIVRWVFALSVPFSLGITFLGYLVFWALIPVGNPGTRDASEEEQSTASVRR